MPLVTLETLLYLVLSQMSKSLVFLHIPKTGGTSLTNILVKNFEDTDVYPIRAAIHRHLIERGLSTYKLACGHFEYDDIIDECGRKNVDIITMLREPKARILSAYYFLRSHKVEYHESETDSASSCIDAKNLSLLEFLKQGKINDNEMIRMLTKDEKISAKSVVKAISRVKKMRAFGIMEMMDNSVSRICTKLGFPVPDEIPHDLKLDDLHLNHDYCEKITKEEITPEINAELTRLTMYDSRLYDFCVKEFLNG